MPDNLITPMTMSMRLHQQSKSTTPATLLMLEAAMLVDDRNRYAWADMSPATFFHSIAQFVNIHDMAFYILRSKLDYLATLRFEKLANLPHRYTRRSMAKQGPKGAALEVPARFRNPSWIEENRALQALWFLTVGWRGSLLLVSDELDAIGIAKRLTGTEKSWLHDEIEEMARSVLEGPVLQPPESNSGSHTVKADPSFARLKVYPIPRYPQPAYLYPSSTITLSPLYANSPNTPPTSTSESLAWGRAPDRLSNISRARLLLQRLHQRPDSPFREPSLGHASNTRSIQINPFTRLGFGIWDLWRVSAEMRLLSMPFLIRQGRQEDGGGKGRLGQSDGLFRCWVLYRQEEEREGLGWKRGFDLGV